MSLGQRLDQSVSERSSTTASSDSPFHNELLAHIKETALNVIHHPGDYALPAAAALTAAGVAFSLTPWGQKMNRAALDSLKLIANDEPATAALAHGKAGAGLPAGETAESLNLSARRIASAAREEGLSWRDLSARSGLQTVVRHTQEADADLLGAMRMRAEDSAMTHFPALEPEAAAELVDALKAFPAAPEFAGKVDVTGQALDLVIRTSRTIDEKPQSIAAAKALSQRAGAYEHLGHFAEALEDLGQSIEIGGEVHKPLYQRSNLLERLGRQADADHDLLEAHRAIAHHTALQEGVHADEAADYVRGSRAFPATIGHARPVAESSEAVQHVVRTSRRIEELDFQSNAKVNALEFRAKLYRRLGQDGAAELDEEAAVHMERRLNAMEKPSARAKREPAPASVAEAGSLLFPRAQTVPVDEALVARLLVHRFED